MIKEIVTNTLEGTAILTQKSTKVLKEDNVNEIITDLLDTAKAHKEVCAELTAIQIGVPKRVCVIADTPDHWLVLINPVIMKRSQATHISTEGCLSVDKTSTTKRHNSITIMSETNGKARKRSFSGFIAVVVQHEIDHMNGIII